jgi:Tfx family DNA-binding protein
MLTEKEIEVLKLRKLGLTQVEVSKKLEISQAAVSSFEKNAYRKIEDAQKTLKIAEELHLIPGEEKGI